MVALSCVAFLMLLTRLVLIRNASTPERQKRTQGNSLKGILINTFKSVSLCSLLTFRGRCILGVWSESWFFVVVVIKNCVVEFITISI